MLPIPRRFCDEMFVRNNKQVSPIGTSAPVDWELNMHTSQLYYSLGNTIYIVNVNPNTGERFGQPKLITTGLVKDYPLINQPLLGNGGEWGGGSKVYYMKAYLGSDRILHGAYLVDGNWISGPLTSGRSKGIPWPSKDTINPNDSLIYAIPATGIQNKFPYDAAVRLNADNSAQVVIPRPVIVRRGGPRWFPNQKKIVFWYLDARNIEQVGTFDAITSSIEPVTSFLTNLSIDESWASYMPEVGDIIWFTIDEREFWVFTKEPTGWAFANIFNPALLLGLDSITPVILSPEPIEYNGKSYIAFQLTNNNQTVSNVYICEPWATEACHIRQINHDGLGLCKKPEWFVLQNPTRVVLYYLNIYNDVNTIWLGETGI